MLYYVSQLLAKHFHSLEVFQYLTLRTILSALTALLLSFCLGPVIIRQLSKRQLGQVIRQEGPQSHLSKSGTPTMGGVLIVLVVVLSTLLWGDLGDHYVWLVLIITVLFALIGGWDDYLKISRKHSQGLLSRHKYALQSLVAVAAAIYLYSTASMPTQTDLIIPFFKDVTISLGLLFIILTYFVIIGSSNAVNLTDGLDGLAITLVVMVSVGLGVFSYAIGNINFAHYLLFSYLPGVGEMAVICGAIVGAGLGFLWFNTYPAQIFMGDVGSLSLGAALGLIAVIVRQEIAFFIMSGIFVAETLSVIMQVASFKLTGKRIFRMAPLHHHFEEAGWPEPRVIVRFWIITFILVLLALATLKLR